MTLGSKRFSRRDMVKLGIVGTVGAASALAALTGCSSTSSTSSTSASSAADSGQASSSAAGDVAEGSLEGKELDVYCGAGMTEPFSEIAQLFQDKTGCTMNVTYANAAQIQTQINESQQGDLWIAGSTDEAQRVSDLIANSTNLVKHIPVIIVPDDNPKDVQTMADLENVDILLIGDPDSVAIGKVAKNALTEAGLWDAVQDKITTTTTAPQITTALASGQGDAGIVWKENVKDGVTIVAEEDMEPFIMTIPAVELTIAKNTEALASFMEYLASSEAQDVWTAAGYELAD